MRRLLFTALLAAAVAACGDNHTPPVGDDAAVEVDAGPPDAAIDGGPTVVSCALDRPGSVDRPPAGVLPCDLLPPGFAP